MKTAQALAIDSQTAEQLRTRFRTLWRRTPAGCWRWTGTLHREGYGTLGVLGRPNMAAHRVSYAIFAGPIPAEKWVLHKCDNKWCINPDHLYLGDRADNVRDFMQRGDVSKLGGARLFTPEVRERCFRNLPRGERHHASKLTTEEARAIYEATGSQRVIGERFGVNQNTVSLIKRKKIWRHVHESV